MTCELAARRRRYYSLSLYLRDICSTSHSNLSQGSRILMICCVSRAKMHFEHRKMDESCSFWLFFYIFSFSEFWPVLGWSDCQFRPRGSISSPGMVPDRSGPKFYIYSNFLFIWCSCADPFLYSTASKTDGMKTKPR